MESKICPQCKKAHLRPYQQLCNGCQYENMYAYMLDQDADDQDWEFAHCEECGSALDSRGICRNTNCGNSPDVGTDWY